MTTDAQKNTTCPANDGASRATELFLVTAPAERCTQGVACRLHSFDRHVDVRSSCWRVPENADHDATPLPSRDRHSSKALSGEDARHLNTIQSWERAVELLPTARDHGNGADRSLENRIDQQELTIVSSNLTATHMTGSLKSEPFNGGTADGKGRRHDEPACSETGRTLKNTSQSIETMGVEKVTGEMMGVPSKDGDMRMAAVGVHVLQRARLPRADRTNRGLPGWSRRSRHGRPTYLEYEANRVGVLSTSRRVVPSTCWWIDGTETRDPHAPTCDDLPVVAKSGRPRMFQEEAIHGSVQVCLWSRLVRQKFGELPIDPTVHACHPSHGSEHDCTLRHGPTEPSRHQGLVDGPLSGACRAKEPAPSARCLDGASSAQLLGIGMHSHVDDLDGLGSIDNAAFFTRLGVRR